MKNSERLVRRLWSAGCWLGLTTSFGITVCLAEIPGYPGNVMDCDPREVAMLPNYCIYTELRIRVPAGNNPAEIKRWQTIMGPIFGAMHHYCWGLMKTNRANILARTQQDRRFYLNDAIGEFNFVIQRAPPDFVLLPEILTKKGENLLRLGKAAQAMVELERAIELKPNYWPPYIAMSDHYKATGQIAKARETLETALSHSPDSKSLKSRLAELETTTRKP